MVERPPQDILYFAYGSNLDVDRMQERTGHIPGARRGCLYGYRLAFNKRASRGGVYANIVPSDTDQVWGVVYRCDPHAMKALDACEGVGTGHYRRIHVTILLDDGSTVESDTYVAAQQCVVPEGSPAADYLERILRGARHHRLPDEYVRKIEAVRHG